MENASKALIIAGAILLAILIIGLGIFIYRQAANTVSDTGMDQLSIQQFNGQFENYLDKQLTSTSAKALIDTIKTNNAGKQSGENGYVSITGVTDKSAIKASSKYKATATMTNGIITAINIEDPEANAGEKLQDLVIQEQEDVGKKVLKDAVAKETIN